jgi:hypothetical protein
MLLSIWLLLAATVSAANAASFFTFQVPGCGPTSAAAINDNNVVVGGCGDGTDSGLPYFPRVVGRVNAHGAAVLQSTYISPDGTTARIEIPGCANIDAEAINDNGWVTGSCGNGKGFVWMKP